MFNLRLFIFLLFLPAGLGLAVEFLTVQTNAERLLLLALLLFCPELAYMAWVDFTNIQAAAQVSEDSRLSLFYKIVFSTFVLELLGFYGALVSLQWGGIIVIFSQLWFNLLAKIQLSPGEAIAIEPFGIAQRLPVLIANGLAIVLFLLWPIASVRLWLALILLLLIMGFLLLKYAVLKVLAKQVD